MQFFRNVIFEEQNFLSWRGFKSFLKFLVLQKVSDLDSAKSLEPDGSTRRMLLTEIEMVRKGTKAWHKSIAR